MLATARLGLGELDQACALGAEAAQQAAEMRSARAVEYVRDFERRLEPYRDAAAVRTYRDRMARRFGLSAAPVRGAVRRSVRRLSWSRRPSAVVRDR